MDKALEHRESKRLVESVALQRHGHKHLTSTKNGSERANHWQRYRKKRVTWHLYSFYFHFWNLLLCHFPSSFLYALVNMHNIFQPRGCDLPRDPFYEWLTLTFPDPEFCPKCIYPTFHSHRRTSSVANYPKGSSFSILSVANGTFQRWYMGSLISCVF